MVQLKIQYFGPISCGFCENEGFISFTPLTVICGNQATGKSTIAKLFSTFTWLEKAIVRGDYDKVAISNKKFFINFLVNQRIHEYLSEKTEIIYIGEAYIFSFRDNNFIAEENKENIHNYIRPKIMYIPSERNLITIIEDADKIKSLPIMLSILLDRYRIARKELAQDKYELPVPNFKIKFDIDKNKTFVISRNNKKIDISNSSSGIQSITPIALVSDYLSKIVSQDIFMSVQKLSASERDKIRIAIKSSYKDNPGIADVLIKELNMCFLTGLQQGIEDSNIAVLASFLKLYFNQCFINIVEEPEQNLFPESQSKVLYKLLECLNFNPKNQLLITTHSPYIIPYLTLCAKAFELKKKGCKLDEIEKVVPLNSIISGEAISIYETTEDGCVKLLKPYENFPSDDNLLNKLMADQNLSFANLLELEDKL